MAFEYSENQSATTAEDGVVSENLQEAQEDMSLQGATVEGTGVVFASNEPVAENVVNTVEGTGVVFDNPIIDDEPEQDDEQQENESVVEEPKIVEQPKMNEQQKTVAQNVVKDNFVVEPTEKSESELNKDARVNQFSYMILLRDSFIKQISNIKAKLERENMSEIKYSELSDEIDSLVISAAEIECEAPINDSLLNKYRDRIEDLKIQIANLEEGTQNEHEKNVLKGMINGLVSARGLLEDSIKIQNGESVIERTEEQLDATVDETMVDEVQKEMVESEANENVEQEDVVETETFEKAEQSDLVEENAQQIVEEYLSEVETNNEDAEAVETEVAEETDEDVEEEPVEQEIAVDELTQEETEIEEPNTFEGEDEPVEDGNEKEPVAVESATNEDLSETAEDFEDDANAEEYADSEEDDEDDDEEEESEEVKAFTEKVSDLMAELGDEDIDLEQRVNDVEELENLLSEESLATLGELNDDLVDVINQIRDFADDTRADLQKEIEQKLAELDAEQPEEDADSEQELDDATESEDLEDNSYAQSVDNEQYEKNLQDENNSSANLFKEEPYIMKGDNFVQQEYSGEVKGNGTVVGISKEELENAMKQPEQASVNPTEQIEVVRNEAEDAFEQIIQKPSWNSAEEFNSALQEWANKYSASYPDVVARVKKDYPDAIV